MRYLFLVSLLSIGLWGQNPQSLTLEAPPPAPVKIINVQLTGAGGGATYYYWVVTTYPVGKVLSVGYGISNAPSTLSVGNYITVYWDPQPGATSYDVLRTTTPNAPGNTCTCAVATGVTSNSYSNTSNTLSVYTLNLVQKVTGSMSLNNQSYSVPYTIWTLPIMYNFPVYQITFSDGTTMTTASGGGGTIYYQTLQKATVSLTQRGKLNFIQGANTTLTVADNAGNGSTDVTIAATGTVTGSGTIGKITKFTGAGEIGDSTALDIVGEFSGCSGTYYLGADGSCHANTGVPGGADTSVQINDSGAFYGDATNFNWNKTTHILKSTGGFDVGSGSILDGSTDGSFLMTNRAGSSFTSLQFGGTSASFPMLKRSTTSLQVRLADDTGYADAAVQNLTVNGTCTGCGSGNASPFGASGSTLHLANGTYYGPLAGILVQQGTESLSALTTPVSGNLGTFCVSLGYTDAQPGDGALTFTIRTGATLGTMADSTVVVTFAAGATAPATACDSTHTVAVTAGNFVSVKMVNAASTNSAYITGYTFKIQ